MITDDRVELMDGYRILKVSNETRTEVEVGLASGHFDGLSFNPYNGWAGDLSRFLDAPLTTKAYVFPFADKVGFEPDFLGDRDSLEMLLLSEFSGRVDIFGRRLKKLRMEYKPGVTLGFLPSLTVLDASGVTQDFLRSIGDAAKEIVDLTLVEGTFTTLDGIEKLESLRGLGLYYSKRLCSIASLVLCRQLRELCIASGTKVADLVNTLEGLPKLRALELSRCGTIENLGFLEKLSDLEIFTISSTKILSKRHPALARIKHVHGV